MLLKPGVISGGSITHDCPLSRSVGYFIEPLVMIAPFSKKPFNLTIRGITSDDRDLSVDLLRTVTLPHLQLFGIEDGLELRVRQTLFAAQLESPLILYALMYRSKSGVRLR